MTVSPKPRGVWAESQPWIATGAEIWIADARRDDGKRFIERADEKPAAFVELESQLIRTLRNVGHSPTFFY